MDDSYSHNGGGGTLVCEDYGYYFYNFIGDYLIGWA